MTTRAALFLVLSLVLSAPSAAADDESEAHALAEGLLSISGLLPSHALILELKRVVESPAHSVETRERALAEYAFRLRERAPDPAAWAGLEFLAGYRERAAAPHPESSAYLVPSFNVAATARGTINLWLRLTARRHTAAELAAGSFDFLDAADHREHPQQIAGIVAALGTAEPERLEGIRAALATRYPADPGLAPVALAVARALGDEALLEEVITHAPRLRFRIVYELDRYLPPERADRRWRRLASAADPQRAAAAIAALADKAEATPALFELFASRLADPEVGVAAAGALGRLRLPDRVPRLASMLTSDDRATAARAALALKLDGSPAALAALRASPLAQARRWLQ